MSVLSDTQIANRALQRVGGERIGVLDPTKTLWTEDSKNADEIRACYHILRRTELRRNVWRFAVRTIALRAIGDSAKLVTFAAWVIGTTYAISDIVTGSDGQIYISSASGNVGNDPTTTLAKWTLYFGSTIAQEYVGPFSTAITYALNDHTVGSDGQVYFSLAAGNINHNPVGDVGVHWAVVTDGTMADANSYYTGELIYMGASVFVSLRNENEDVPPTSKWLTMTTAPTVAPLNFVYPIGAGPDNEQSSKNVFQLPTGFMRIAPQDPKAGANSFLGAPSGTFYRDWNFEGNYFTTHDTGIILFRFAADVVDPSAFDAMFVEGFASRVAFEVCQPITQSGTKLTEIASEYKMFMGEARTVNGIEEGATQPPEDDYITCRY